MKKANKQRGFNLLELLIVIALIGILTSVILTSLGGTRVKAADAKRLSELDQLEKALALYYFDNGQYPPITTVSFASYQHADPDRETSWEEELMDVLISGGYLGSFIPSEATEANEEIFRYDSDTGDLNQTYGLSIPLDSPGNVDLKANDGGYEPNFYETGQQPRYCFGKYAGRWAVDINPTPTVCTNGN